MLSRLPCRSQDSQEGSKEVAKNRLSGMLKSSRLSEDAIIEEFIPVKTENKKKGLLAAIWESMTKTGGCCGPGENCCGPSAENDKETDDNEAAEESAKYE